jgi:hypothetical protein
MVSVHRLTALDDPTSIEPASVAEVSRFFIRALKARFRDHRAELLVIRRHIRADTVVCDVGANKGSFVYWLSRWCPAGRVVAFEPQAALARRLATVCAAIGLRNVMVEASAVSSGSGHGALFVPDGHQPGASLHHAGLRGEKGATISVPVFLCRG